MFETITHPKQRAFLAAFVTCGEVKRAAEIAEISRDRHYDWREHDSAYAAAFARAEGLAGDALEDEARRRGLEGDIEYVLYQGEIVLVPDPTDPDVRVPLVRRKRSDMLLAMVLRAAKPEKYKDRLEQEIKPAIPEVNLSALTDEELELLESLAAKTRLAGPRPRNFSPFQLEEHHRDSEPGGGASGTPAAPALPSDELLPG